MAAPEIKIIALSNVFSRMMFFKNKGDIEQGHKHNYDHATLVSSGSILVEVVDIYGKIEHTKEFKSPNMIYIRKDKYHRLTALEDQTLCVCIHAIRTIDEEIVDPNFLIEPIGEGEAFRELVKQKYDKNIKEFIIHPTHRAPLR